MCEPYRRLGRLASARVRVPVLSLLLETIPGNDTSSSVCGLLLGRMVGDANSIVSEAAESRTKVAKFLILVFMKRCEFYGFSSRISRYERSVPARREANFYTLCLILQMRFLARTAGRVR